jgi:hypothetical protein
MAAAHVPLSLAPGEARQFDWSHEAVLPNGVTVIAKAAHVRLCHGRMPFVRAYPRATREMVFDARDRAFALFKGTRGRGVHDNMKTAAEAVFAGKDRQYNRRFLQMRGHYLVGPVARAPASGWEKGGACQGSDMRSMLDGRRRAGRESGRAHPRALFRRRGRGSRPTTR